ncbi:MAG: hypothetical protein LUC18_00075 [Porphyromonadaceae bacterium]|nr:hypothetical protein [Porphyromonadaceae bacterium]
MKRSVNNRTVEARFSTDYITDDGRIMQVADNGLVVERAERMQGARRGVVCSVDESWANGPRIGDTVIYDDGIVLDGEGHEFVWTSHVMMRTDRRK